MVAMHLSVVRPPGTGSVDFRSAFKLSPQTEVYAILHRDLKIIGTLPPLTSLRAVATFAVSAIIHQNERT